MSYHKEVHEGEDGWYFWDESHSDRFGPYQSKDVAIQARIQYMNFLDGEDVGAQIPISNAKERRDFIEYHQSRRNETRTDLS
jgi:hypothetical protein